MILTIILITVIIILSYIIYNLFKKVDQLEQWVGEYANRIIAVNKQIHDIDTTGAFEHDDDVGGTFRMIKEAIEDLVQLFENEEIE